MRMRKELAVILSVMLVLVLALSMAACAKPSPAPAPTPGPTPAPAPPAAKAPWKIGSMYAITGFFAFLGDPASKGGQLWIDEVNKRGGINGHPVELTLLDDEGDEAKAVVLAKRLIETDNVHTVSVGLITGINLAVRPTAAKMETTVLGASGSQVPDKPAFKWYFRPGNSDFGQMLGAKELWQKLGIKKIGVLNPNTGVGKGTMLFLPIWIKEHLGMEFVGVEWYGPQDTDMTAQLGKLSKAGAEALVIWGGGEPAAGLAVKQAREMGLKVHIYGTSPMGTPGVMKIAGEYYDIEKYPPGFRMASTRPGLVDQLPTDSPDYAKLKEANELWKNKYGGNMPSTAAGGLVISQFITDAMSRTNVDPANVKEARIALRDAMEATKGLITGCGTFTMSPDNHHGLHYGTYNTPVYFKGGQMLVDKELAAGVYDSEPPPLWYPYEWESPEKVKEPRVR